ncbi:MAG TPA: hypothetical protein VK425_03795 [Acidimicrobiales bacterium]|nr:hypothetical protein [Acidimicrobiales bacterium]
MAAEALSHLPVDDPRRLPVRRAVHATLWAVAAFALLVATKPVRPLYNDVPWLNDPYDTVVSFTMFFVPLVAVFLLVQVSLCLRTEALPTARGVAILRACRVAAAAAGAGLVTGWAAFALGANRAHWALAATGTEVGLLMLATVLTTRAGFALLGAPRLEITPRQGDRPRQDWVADALGVARRESRRLGQLRPLALTVLDWSGASVLPLLRRRPVLAAAIASAAFGTTVLGWQGYRERYSLTTTLVAICLGFCGMFAFLVPTGSYLRLVESSRPCSGLSRRAIDASVMASGAAIVVLAFRNSLWWAVGTAPAEARTSQLALLVGGGALATFLTSLGAESLLHAHGGTASRLSTSSSGSD